MASGRGGTQLLHVTAALFLIGLIAFSYGQGVVSAVVFSGLLILLFLKKEHRITTSLFIAFLIGFFTFIMANNFLEATSISKEMKILLNRLFLFLILLALVFHSLIFSRKIFWYNSKPNWKNPIILPFHQVNIFWFWLIGIMINGIVYSFFISQKDFETIRSLFLFCLCFSLINAIFEEVIWRGFMLSVLKEFTSTGYAIFITSVGFGLLHLVIGFSLALCLLISIAGGVYAVITLKTNSIYPSVIFHFVVNVGMVYSGFII